MEILLNEKSAHLLAPFPQVPTHKVRQGGKMPICPGPGLPSLDPPYIWLEASRVGISGLSHSIFNSYPFFYFSPTPEVRWLPLPESCYTGQLPLSKFDFSGKGTGGRGSCFAVAVLESTYPSLEPHFLPFHHIFSRSMFMLWLWCGP